MIVVFWIMALLFASIGSLLLIQGLLVFFAGLSGGGVGGLVEACFAPLPFYASYLFARTAVRVRRARKEDPVAARSQRMGTRALVWFTVANVTAVAFLPVPGVLKAVMIVGNLLVFPLILARDVEPSKRKHQSS